MSEYTTKDPKVFGEDMKFFLSFPIGGYYKEPVALDWFGVYSSNPDLVNDIQAETGQTGTPVTSWTQRDDGKHPIFELTYGAITDPNPSSTSMYETYYYGVRFQLTAGNTIEQKNSFIIFRPQCVITQMNVTYAEIVQRMGFLDNLSEGEEYVSGMISDARQEILNELTGVSEYSLHHFHDLARANSALKYKTLCLIALDYAASAADEDKWLALYRQFKSIYDTAISVAKVGVDANKDGVWTPDETLDDTEALSDYVFR